MNGEQRTAVRKRRTLGEVRQLVAEFVSSDMRRSEFCRTRGLSVVLSGGRKIEVQRDFDLHTFERLVSVLERAVLPGLADRPIQRLPELIPAAWVTRHP